MLANAHKHRSGSPFPNPPTKAELGKDDGLLPLPPNIDPLATRKGSASREISTLLSSKEVEEKIAKGLCFW